MKKFLLYLIIFIFSTPVFASCSINKPCTADNSILNPIVRNDSNPFDKESDKNIKKSDVKFTTPAKTDTRAYDASCQFGICLPKNVSKSSKNP